MPNKNFCFAIVLALAVLLNSCQSSDTKVYKVDYRGNYPSGTFKAVIGNITIFTNGGDILELHVKKFPDFFCYSVNKGILCNFNFNVKMSEDSTKRFRDIAQNLQTAASKSGKNKTILSQRINYYVNDKKLDEEDVILSSKLKDELTNVLSISVLGKGKDEKESKENAIKKFDDLLRILIDKPE